LTVSIQTATSKGLGFITYNYISLLAINLQFARFTFVQNLGN